VAERETAVKRCSEDFILLVRLKRAAERRNGSTCCRGTRLRGGGHRKEAPTEGKTAANWNYRKWCRGYICCSCIVPNTFLSFFRAESSIWWSGEDGQPSKCWIGLYALFFRHINSKCRAILVLMVRLPHIGRKLGFLLWIPSQNLHERISFCYRTDILLCLCHIIVNVLLACLHFQ